MIDIQTLRADPEGIRENLARRQVEVDLDQLLALDGLRSRLIQELDALRQERNQIADQVAKASPEDRPALVQRGKDLKQKIVEAEPNLAITEEQ